MDVEEPEFRKRREWEDTLLNSRTGVFLILNGFALQGKPSIPLAIAVSGINFLWVLASAQSHFLIRKLSEETSVMGVQNYVTEVLGHSKLHHALRPTTIIGKWIPLYVYWAWLVYIALEVSSFGWLLVVAFFPAPFVIRRLLGQEHAHSM